MRRTLSWARRNIVALSCCLLALLAAYLFASHAYWLSPRGRIVALNRMYEADLTRMLQHAEQQTDIDLGAAQNVWSLPSYPMNTRIPDGMSLEEFEELTTAVFISFMDNHPDKSPVFLSYSKPDFTDYSTFICPDEPVMEGLRQQGYPVDYGRNGNRPAGEVGFGYWGTQLCVLAIDQSKDSITTVALSNEGGCLGSTEIAYVMQDDAGSITSIVWHSQLVDDVLDGLDDSERRVALRLPRYTKNWWQDD